MSNIPGHKATEVAIESLPFYKSLQVVVAETGIDWRILMKRQSGFKATPACCKHCGQEWNAYDVIINTVAHGPHDWNFLKTKLTGDTDKFFFRSMSLNCVHCKETSKDVGVLYDYAPTQWNSDVRYKEDIRPVGQLANGLTLYQFRYKGAQEKFVGVLAQEAKLVCPESVHLNLDGLYSVDYAAIGFTFQRLDDWRRAST
jgi:hypothetical protein